MNLSHDNEEASGAAPGRLVIFPARCRGCRSCQLACSFVRTGVYNPSQSCIELERDLRTEKTAPMIQALACDLCGGQPACVEACAYDALTFEPEAQTGVEVRFQEAG